jgi:hypothetical protein
MSTGCLTHSASGSGILELLAVVALIAAEAAGALVAGWALLRRLGNV